MAEVVEVLLRARMEASGVETGVNQIKNSLKGLTLPKGITDDLEKSFSKLTPLLKDYQKQLNKGFSNKRDLQNFNTLKEKIDETFADIKTQVQKANSEQIRLKVDTQEIDRLEKQIASKTASLQKTLDSVVTKNFNFDSISKKFEEKTKGVSSTTLTSMWGKASEAFQTQDYIRYNQILDETRNKILSFSKIRFDLAKTLGFNGTKTDIKGITEAIDDFFSSIKVNSGQIERIGRTKEEIKGLKSAADTLKFDSLDTGKKALEGLEKTLDRLTNGFKETGSAATEAGNSTVRMSEEVNQLKTSTQYFFSLRNMINLFRRGVQEAVQTVKELDAAMTETAVVTKYSVADMWDKLPQYTAMANKLGGTIKGAYETTTLYYQQGLDTDAAMGIGEETIKMARIAGLDYAETTDMMTAALRGFNMELNSLSAQHINDVYSELAAKTASNTQEIGSAMERTASIAHSAGMSFEGTSAFLAQMIETTREAPENLGTAMKTIIARFQELKKDPMDMEEVDGELPDYNKVDTALKSIGVNLKNERGEFRALDDVFIDIAKRWDSLDQRQQRYVATTAAGSRQQSRFIAMMNNYERTAELMTYANDSAGASQEQFNKTLDSFEAKANKLKNAWDQFLMGIANNQIIKGGLDLLTGIITTINKLIDTVSGGFGPLKSFLSLFTAFAGLKMGGGLVNRLIGGLGGMLDPRSSFKKGFGVGATGFNSAQAAQISNPIVAELQKIYGVITKTNNNSNNNDKITGKDYLKNYLSANKQFRAISKNGSTSVNKVADIFNTVDNNQGRLIFNNSRGTVNQLKRTFNTIFKKANLDDQMIDTGNKLVKEMFKGVKSGEIPAKEMASALVDPTKLGKIIGTDSAKEVSEQLKTNLFKNTRQTDFYKEALKNLGKENLTGKERRAYLKNNKAEVRAAIQQAKEQHIANQLSDNGEVLIEQATFSEKAANAVGHLGSAFSTTGQAASAFGMILSNMGLESAGAAFMSLGNTISSVGMAVNSLSGTITALGFGPAMAALAAIAIPASIVISTKIEEGNIKEEAEKITKTYNDITESTTQKINGLEANRDILNKLASGVDAFGNNVSLTNEEYDQFLSASREVAELAPSLVKGYNAQGEAIVATGKALDERIAKEKELQEIAQKNYVSTSSLDALADAVRISDEFKKYKSFGNSEFEVTVPDNKNANASMSYLGDISPRTKKTNNLVNTEVPYLTKEITGLYEELNKVQEAGVDVDKTIEKVFGKKIDWSNLSLSDIELLTEKAPNLLNQITDEYRLAVGGAFDETNQEVVDSLNDTFDTVTQGWADLTKAAEPLRDSLQQYLTSINMDAAGLQLSDEFVAGFNNGLNRLAIQGTILEWSGADFQKEAKEYAESWDKLAGAGSPYAQTMEQINELQEEYQKNIGDPQAERQYEESVKSSTDALRDFADQMDTSTIAGQQMQAMLLESANNADNFASTVQVTLADALNTLSDRFEHARSAKEEFDKAIEGGDYYTAADNFKSIYDTATSDKNSLGNGSLTFWAGAEQLLGKDTLEELGYDIDKVRKKLLNLSPALEEGAEGFNSFIELVNDKKGTKGLDKFIQFKDDGSFDFDLDPNENLEDLADILDIDIDLLSAFLEKARQYADLDFSDPKQARGALMQDERALQGQGKNGTLYIKDTTFEESAQQAGYRPDAYEGLEKNLSKQNIEVLRVEDLVADKTGADKTNSLLQDVGLTTSNSLSDAVQVFSKMGFTLDETKKILSQDKVDINGSREDIEAAWTESAYNTENPTVAEINDYTAGILDNTTAMLTAMGILNESVIKDIDKSVSEDELNKTRSNLIDKEGKLKDFKTDTEYSRAKEQVNSKIKEYESTLAALERGKSEATDAYTQGLYEDEIEKVTEAKTNLETLYNQAEEEWSTKTSELTNKLSNKGIDYSALGAGSDQQYLDKNTVEITGLLNGDLQTGLDQLKQLQEEGNLSDQTIQNLGLSLIKLNSVEFSNLDTKTQQTYLKLLNLKDTGEQLESTLSQPFSVEVYDQNSEEELSKLTTYVNEIDSKFGESGVLYRSIIFSSEFDDESDRVGAYLDQINEEFEGGKATKTLVIQAAAELAAGNEPEAMELLTQAYGDNAKEAEKRLDVLCEGHIVNADTFKQGLQNEAQELLDDGTLSESLDLPILADIQEVEHPVTLTLNDVQARQAWEAAKEDFTKPVNMPFNAEDHASSIIVPMREEAAKDIDFDIYGHYRGPLEINITKKITTKKDDDGSGASGINNTIPVHKSISFNSFAKGYNGPGRKGSKITALTGEKGYEVAWIPSEQRSTILGVNGPEMATFPADTVIYNHEQSKKILKGNPNRLNLGSFSGESGHGNLKPVSTDSVFNTETTEETTTTSDGKTKKKTTEEKIKVTNNFSLEEVYRFEVEGKIKNYQNKIDKWGKKFNDLIDKAGTKLSDVTGLLKNQRNYLSKIEKENENLVSSYKKDLHKLADKSYKTKISYTPNGGTESKEETVDLSKFIYHFKKSGKYGIRQNAIKRAADGDPAKAEAIYKAAEGALSPLLSGLDSAQKAADSAREELDELSRKTYEAFYGWKNEITKIYNLTQKLEQGGQLRDRYEAQMNLDLARVSAGFSSISKATKDLIRASALSDKALRTNIRNSYEMIRARGAELKSTLSYKDELATYNEVKKKNLGSGATNAAKEELDATKAALKYVSGIKKFKDGHVEYNIDWEKFKKNQKADPKNKEFYDKIKEKLDDINSAASEYNQAIQEATTTLTNVYEELRNYQETIADMEDTLLKQLQEDLQKQIDNSKTLNNSLTNALKSMLDQVKKRLDQRRQAEDNAKTESEIAQKQQRLNYLRANTAGGNQVEIAQLEKEIGESQQSYQRTLEDQMLNKLQEQGDAAAAQRERQIAIAEAQMELSRSSNAELVAMWLKDPIKYKEQIKEAWLEAQGYNEKGEMGKTLLNQDYNKVISELSQALFQTQYSKVFNDKANGLGPSLSRLAKQLEGEISSGKVNGKTLSQILNAITKDNTNGNKAKGKTNKSTGIGNKAKGIVNKSTKSTPKKELKTYAQHGGSLPVNWPGSFTVNYTKSIQKFLKAIGLYKDSIDGSYGPNTRAATRAFQKKVGLNPDGSFGPDTLKKAKLYKYKKGGLAPFTGPAWLDGTPSKPEAVLSAADTKNFVQLKDILASIMKNGAFDTPVTATGDTTYEININVDHLNNDYDVDKVADRVKKLIVKDSSYRNVTSVRKFR